MTQANIDAGLIQQLRYALDEYEEETIEADGIIRILRKYAKEIVRQKYLSNNLVDQVLIFLDSLVYKIGLKETKMKIEIADEIVYLCECISRIYVRRVLFQQYSWNDSEFFPETSNHKGLVENTVHLYEVCFSVAHDGTKQNIYKIVKGTAAG